MQTHERIYLPCCVLLAHFLSIIQIPLIHQGYNTFVGTTQDDEAFALRVRCVRIRQLRLDHLFTNFGLCVLYTSALELADEDCAVIETFLVRDLFSLSKLPVVLLGLDL